MKLGEAGEVVLEAVIKGDTVREVLQYVEFNTDALVTASCAPTSRRPCARAA